MNEHLQGVQNILDLPSGAKIEMYVVLSEDKEAGLEREYRRFQATEDLLSEINDDFLDDTIRKRFLNEAIDVIPESLITSDLKGIYQIEQSDVYHPFDFDKVCNVDTLPFSFETRDRLEGLIWRLAGNADAHFWVYQHIYAISPARRKLSIATLQGGSYLPATDTCVMIEHRVDAIIADNMIYVEKLNLLERYFGYEQKIRAEATRAIEVIENSDLFEGTDVLHECLLDEDMANIKRITKLKESPILELSAEELRSRIKSVPTYDRNFDMSGGKVIIRHETIKEFSKLLGDDLVESPLTGIRYDAPKKKVLRYGGKGSAADAEPTVEPIDWQAEGRPGQNGASMGYVVEEELPAPYEEEF